MTTYKQFCRKLIQFFDFTGRWDEWLWLSEQADACAIAVIDKESRVAMHITQG